MPVNLTPLGNGRPDYSVDIGKSTVSASMIKDYKLKPNEKLKVFQVTFSDTPSVYPWVRAGLNPGEETHLIDMETGLPTPYTVSAGYDFQILKYWYNSNESLRLEFYIDGYLVGVMYPGDVNTYYEQEVGLLRRAWFDPDFDSDHTVDAKIINAGNDVAYGTVQIICVLRKIGSGFGGGGAEHTGGTLLG